MLKVFFACGGSGGHVNPAIAIADYIKTLPGAKICFGGAVGGIENTLVPRAGYDIKTVVVSNFRRSLSPGAIKHNIISAKNAAVSRGAAAKILKEFAPDIVVGMGGFASYPFVKAAQRLGIKTAIHESNAVPGLTTKTLAKKADAVLVNFEQSKKDYDPAKTHVVGMPARAFDIEGIDLPGFKQELFGDQKPIVLAFWGSLGALNLNLKMVDFIKLASTENKFNFVMATGKNSHGRVLEKMKEQGIENAGNIRVVEYIYEMPKYMAAADLVLCRAGASTLSEICVVAKPAVFIPSPYVTANHQFENARIAQATGGAVILEENKAEAGQIYNTVAGLVKDKERLAQMAAGLKVLSVNNSVSLITQILLDLVK